MSSGTTQPLTTSSLSEAERERLTLLRRWMMGWETRNPQHWEEAWRELSRRYGSSSARQILLALECFLRSLSQEAASPISYHRPCCGCLSHEERLLLDMVRLRQGAGLYSRAAELLEADGVAPVLACAQRLAAAFELAVFEPDGRTAAGGDRSAPTPPLSASAH